MVSSHIQLAREEGSNTSCRFWNFTADGELLRSIHRNCSLSLFITVCINCIGIVHSDSSIICAYISFYDAGGSGAWDSRNCRVLNENAEEVECGCDHLTHFAILLVSDRQLA